MAKILQLIVFAGWTYITILISKDLESRGIGLNMFMWIIIWLGGMFIGFIAIDSFFPTPYYDEYY